MADVADNTGTAYDRIVPMGALSAVEGRWIGRCTRDGMKHKIEGHLMMGHGAKVHDYIIRANDGRVYTMADHGSNVSTVFVHCGDHRCALKRVTEGTKHSKHECGARCTSATGPNCDCRCKGKNHGRDC